MRVNLSNSFAKNVGYLKKCVLLWRSNEIVVLDKPTGAEGQTDGHTQTQVKTRFCVSSSFVLAFCMKYFRCFIFKA